MIIQFFLSWIPSFLGGTWGGNSTQNQKPSEIAGVPLSGAQGAIAPQAQAAAIAPAAPPKPSAEEIMASWKQEMAASTIPQSVQNAIAAKEPQITEQLRAAKSPQEMQTIQMAAYAEATKPEWDKFVAKSKGEVSKLMDDTIREVSQNSNLPAKEKQEALAGLKKEKEARLKGLEAKLEEYLIGDTKGSKEELKQVLIEKRIQIALSKEGQEKIQENITSSVKNYKEAVSKNVSDISRQNNGLAWGSSVLGWGSLALAVGGLAAAPFTGGLSLGLTVAACGTGMAAGACKVANNYDKGGSNFDFGMGIAEIGLNAIPLGGVALKSAGLLARSVEVSAGAASKSEGFRELAWAGTKNIFGYGDPASRAITAGASISHGQTLRAVEMAESVKTVVNAGGRAGLAQHVPEVENAVSKFITTGTKAAPLESAEAQKWVEAAVKNHYWKDPLVGISTNNWRATKVGVTNAGDNLIPSSTPQVLPADGLAKQQSRES